MKYERGLYEWVNGRKKKNRAPDLKYLERESLKKGDSDTGTAADVELVMKKYDRESNTRVWQGKPASIIRWLSVLFSVYSIYVTLFSTALPEIRLSMFLGMILILGYLHYPIQKGDGRINHMRGTTGSDGSGGGSIFLFCGERACDH